MVRKQLAREKLRTVIPQAWGTSPVSARYARKDSFSSSDSSSLGTSVDSQRLGRPSFPVPSGTTSRPSTSGIEGRPAAQQKKFVPISSNSRLLQSTDAQNELRKLNLQYRAELEKRSMEEDRYAGRRSRSVGSIGRDIGGEGLRPASAPSTRSTSVTRTPPKKRKYRMN